MLAGNGDTFGGDASSIFWRKVSLYIYIFFFFLAIFLRFFFADVVLQRFFGRSFF